MYCATWGFVFLSFALSASASGTHPQTGISGIGAFPCGDQGTLNRWPLDAEEQQLIGRAKADFLRAIEALFGAKSLREIHQRTERGEAFPHAVSEVLGKEFVPLAFRVMEHLDAKASERSEGMDDSWRTAETARFIFHYLPGTPGATDLEVLKNQFEKAFRQVSRLLAYEPSEIGIPFQKTRVLLFPHREHAERQGVYLSGQAAISLAVDGKTRRVQADLELLYSSSIQSFPVVHEVTHLVEILKRAQQEDPRALESWIGRITAPRRLGAMGSSFLREGLAEYTANCLSPLVRSGLIPSSDALVRDLLRKGRYVPVEDLVFHLPPSKLHRHTLTVYPEAGSFVAFLVETYGIQPFMRLVDTRQPGADTFQEVYGRSLRELENAWLETLKENVQWTAGKEVGAGTARGASRWVRGRRKGKAPMI